MSRSSLSDLEDQANKQYARREDRYYKFVVENELGLGAIYKKFN